MAVLLRERRDHSRRGRTPILGEAAARDLTWVKTAAASALRP